MPGFDRSGPQGRGSRTGRGMGLCGGGSRAGADWSYGGFGVGRGGRPWGGGRGRCFGGWSGRGRGGGGPAFFGNYPGGAYPSEAEFLHMEAENLRDRLREVEDRLAGMEKSDPVE